MSSNCGCDTEIIYVSGIPGPIGPMGPQGPAGSGTSYPIAASNISVTNSGYSNLQQVLDFLLYIPLTLTSFSSTNPVYLIGTTVSTLTFNWVFNKIFTSGSISGFNLTSLALTTSPQVASLSSPLNPSVVGTSYVYTITATDSTNTPTGNTSISFYNNIYFGDSVIPGSIDSTFINSLTSSIQANFIKTIISNATGSTTYAWFASRSALGTPMFTVAGFPGGFTLVASSLSVTNSVGFTEIFNVYRSINPAIGPVTIQTT